MSLLSFLLINYLYWFDGGPVCMQSEGNNNESPTGPMRSTSNETKPKTLNKNFTSSTDVIATVRCASQSSPNPELYR